MGGYRDREVVPCMQCILIGAQPSWWFWHAANLSEQISNSTRQPYLVEHGLSLTTITALLAVISSFTLSEYRVLALLVLGNFMGRMFFAGLALAILKHI